MAPSSRLLLPLLIFNACWAAPGFSQTPGCTDSKASNYNAQALRNDGTCLYPETLYPLPVKVEPLPEQVLETSGLAFDGRRLWTHNDSNNSNQLFALDTLTGAVRQTVTISNATNHDWEDLAFDGTFLYVADVGNNYGDRKNLVIYKIKASEIGPAAAATVTAQEIHFTYPDQTDFTPSPHATSFDCEALVYFQGALHLFTKDWVSKETKHYTLPTQPGQHVATLKGSFPANGLITGASVSETGELMLIGYDNTGSLLTFMWLFYSFTGDAFFSGNKCLIKFGNAWEMGQIEGVTFRPGGVGYISSEQMSYLGIEVVPPRLYTFSLRQWLPENVTALPDEASGASAAAVWPNPFRNQLVVELPGLGSNEQVYLTIMDAVGREVPNQAYTQSVTEGSLTLRFHHSFLPPGLYTLLLSTGPGRKRLVRKVVRE